MTRLALLVVCAVAVAGCGTGKYKLYNPTMTVPVVEGKVLHPDTGDVIDCEVMGPFEDWINRGQGTNPWANAYPNQANTAVGGRHGFMYGLTPAQVRQGVMISRACRGVTPAKP